MEEGLEAKLARWRRQAEELRLQDKDSAVSRARASRLSRTDEEEQDPVLDDDLVGGPLGSPRRTVVERMRDLKIAERRAELSADVQKLREQEEMDLAQREAREAAIAAERQRLQREVEEDSKKWAEKKNAYWKEGFDSKVDVPRSEDSFQERQAKLERMGITNRPTESITAKLNQWKEMSSTRKARQIAKASADIAVTALNAVAIVVGILLQKPVEVPSTSINATPVRGFFERIAMPLVSKLSRRAAPPNPVAEPPPAKVPTWSDLGPAVTKLVDATETAAVVDVQSVYQQQADEEADYLQKKLREKWRLKREQQRKKRWTSDEAYAKISASIAEGDYGGVRGLLRDTLEMPEVYQALLGYTPSSTDPSCPPPIILAAEAGAVDIAQALMEAGANPRAVDAQGRTASQVAEAAGHAQLAKILITWAATQA